MGIFLKLKWYFIQEWKIYLMGVVGLLLTALLGSVSPWLIGRLIDIIHSGHLTGLRLTFLLGILVLSVVLQYGSRYIWRNAIWGGSAKLEAILRRRLFWHYLHMDQKFFHRFRVGDLMAHATNDLSAIQRVAGGGILQFADSIITGGTTLLAMIIVVNWRLTLIAILPFPILAIAARVLGKKMHSAFKTSQAAFSALNNKAEESISGIKVIKSLGQEKADVGDFARQVKRTIKINRHVNFLGALFDPTTTLVMSISYVVTIVYGGYLVVAGIITVGELVSFVAYLGQLVWPMFALGMLFNTLERGNASYDRVMAILQQKSSIVEKKPGIQTPPSGDLVYHIQSFSYPGDKKRALGHLYFRLPAGHTLGLVGPVGSGKSTLFSLLLRQYDNYQGSICFGGIDIRDFTLDTLLSAIGYVPQETYLFSTTIGQNIRFGRPKASFSQIRQVAKSSDLAGQIAALPQGFATPVGEQGISLSGGQRQRLAIARALLLNPQVLILDDALSAVDAKTETRILQTLRKKRQHKTTLVASSRLSSVMEADKILVLEGGHLIQAGTHEQLMAQGGWYADTFRLQALETT